MTTTRKGLERDDWQQWMCALGGRLRRARHFLGLSQAQVADLAGVSQGAMSRLEHGKGLETPISVVLRLHAAIAQSLRGLAPELLDDELRWVMQFGSMLSGVPEPREPAEGKADVARLFQAVRTLSAVERRLVVSVLSALIETLERNDGVRQPREAERS